MTRNEIIVRIREIVKQQTVLNNELSCLQAQLVGYWDCEPYDANCPQPPHRSA
jgi:hypothetical protein